MADIDKAFNVGSRGLSLNDNVGVFEGTADPSATGEAAPLGSLYVRTGTPELYQKTGATDTDWTKFTQPW